MYMQKRNHHNKKLSCNNKDCSLIDSCQRYRKRNKGVNFEQIFLLRKDEICIGFLAKPKA